MKFKQIRVLLGFLLLLVSFQNCNSPNTTTLSSASKDTQTSKSRTVSSSSGSVRTGSSSSGNLSSGSVRGITGVNGSSSGNTSGTSSSGSMISGGSSSGNSGNNGTCLSCGNAGSSSGTSNGNSTNYDNTFKITKQPISGTYSEQDSFTIGISFQGGQPPYAFKWYVDGIELPPVFGNAHSESYFGSMDRVYKQGNYHVVVKDAAGKTLTSNAASIRMTPRSCSAGNYFIPLSTNPAASPVGTYFNDAFFYNNKKYFTSAQTSLGANLGLAMPSTVRYARDMGWSYFSLGGTAANNQNFSISCSTDVPHIHTSQCAANNPSKCPFSLEGGDSKETYEGQINFICRSGYLEFVSNTCKLIAQPPSPSGNDSNWGGGGAG